MQKIHLGKYDIEKLSKEDLSSYFEKAFNNPIVIQMINNSSSLSQVSTRFNNFGNILQAYLSATGDLSEAMIEKLATDFEQNSDKISQPINQNKIEGIQKYFADYVMPHIITHHANKLKLKEPLSFSETANVLDSIYCTCRNNQFLTHSFNGALLKNIKDEGLNINKELFKEEYAILQEIGLYQPYQKGNLLFCELSKASFSYAQYAPERLIRTLGCMNRHEENQTINEYLTTGFQEQLSSKHLSSKQYQRYFSAGKKMIDFYFGNNAQSAIAFKPATNQPFIDDNKRAHSELRFALTDWRLNSKIEKICKNNNQPEMKNKFDEAIKEIKDLKIYNKMDSFISDFQKQYPDDKTFQTLYKEALTKAVTKDCLNNFMYNGCADGYPIKGGKLEPDNFSLAVIPNPIEQYVKNSKLINTIEKEKLMAKEYNQELYNQKYIFETQSGRIPKESFEEYCTNHFSNIYFQTSKKNGLNMENPQYTAWKKAKGYTDPNSEASKNLDLIISNNKKHTHKYSPMPYQQNKSTSR